MCAHSYKYIPILPLLMYIIGAIYPWRDGIAEGYFAHHRIMQIGLVLYVALSMVCVRELISVKDLYKFVRCGGALCYAGGLVSVLFAISPVHAGFEYVHWALLSILFYYCAHLSVCNDKCSLVLAGSFLLIHGILIFLACLYLSFALINNHPLRAAVIYPATENIRFFNQIQVFVLPLLLLLLKHSRFWFLAGIFFSANVLLICVGGARGAALCIALLLVFVICSDRSLRENVIRGLLLSGLAILIYAGLLLLQPMGLYDISRSGTSGRLEMWIDLIYRLDWHHFFWGIGPANYALLDHGFIFGHPHNSVLQWILEWGGFSFLGLVIVVGHIILKSFSHLKANPDDLMTKGLFLSSLTALAYSLVDGVIVMPIAQTLLIVFMGLLYGRVSQGKQASHDVKVYKSPDWKPFLIGVCVLSITVPYVYLASQYYLQQSASGQKIVGPRFWINGIPLQWPD